MTSEMMDFNNSILTIIMLMSSASIVFIGAYVYVSSQRSSVFNWFEIWMGLLFLWNWSYMIRQLAPNRTAAWIMFGLEVFSVASLGPVLLCFARSYRGWQNWKSWSVRLALTGNAIIILALLTNSWHRSFIRSFEEDMVIYGTLYYLFGLFELICFSGAVAYFVAGTKRPSAYWKNQLYNVGGSMVLLALSGLMQAFGVFGTYLNIPLVLLPFSVIFIGIAVFKYQFLDILPFALSEAINFIDDGFMVFNNDGHLEDCNQPFFSHIVDFEHVKNMEGLIKVLTPVTVNQVSLLNLSYSLTVKENNYISGELMFRLPDGPMYLQYTTKAINDASGTKVANIITFHNITELQLLYKTLEDKTDQLITARKQLETHIDTVQQLTVENERNRLLARVHDTLGHSMAEVLALLEQCQILLRDDASDYQKGLDVIREALIQSRNSLTEIRAAVNEYRNRGIDI